jgi:signal transduction protein with GAF and PtsI domain
MSESIGRKLSLGQFKTISLAISNYEELDLLVRHFVDGMCRAFQFKGASILLYDEREKQLFHMGSSGISETYVYKGPLFWDEEGLAGDREKPIFIDDLQGDQRVQYPAEAAAEGITAMASFPIRFQGATIGILRFYNDRAIRLHLDDMDSIRVLGHLLGLVIECHGLRNFLDGVKGAMASLPLRMMQGL